MHEMSLCESVMQIVEEQARAQSFSNVIAIQLEIGQLAGVDIEAMRFCFDVVARNSIMADAMLDIVSVMGQGVCPRCAATSQMSERFSPCSHCGSYGLQIVEGAQMRIKDLEVQ